MRKTLMQLLAKILFSFSLKCKNEIYLDVLILKNFSYFVLIFKTFHICVIINIYEFFYFP